MTTFLKRKVSFFYIPVTILVTAVATFYGIKRFAPEESTDGTSSPAENSVINASCNFNTARLDGYNFVKPLLFVETSCETNKYYDVKNEVDKYFSSLRSTGDISSASFYLRNMKTHEWVGVNQDEKYSPGSLMKVPELITYLRMAETNPAILDKEILYDKQATSNKTARFFLSKSIEVGKKYKVRDLLRYMISYSDNNATILLNNMIDVKTFVKTFSDLGLKAPDWNASDYPMSAKEYSLFMRTLYNASYLNISNSEYAAELLSTCDFKDGFAKGFPAGIKMAHKWGEARNGNDDELHESGILYINNTAYILTVMTKGKDFNKLPGVIQNVSAVVNRTLAGVN